MKMFTKSYLLFGNNTVTCRALIDHLHASENILITFLIAVMSRLDARKSVLQPMRI